MEEVASEACQPLGSHAGRLRSHGGSNWCPHAGAKSSIRCREHVNRVGCFLSCDLYCQSMWRQLGIAWQGQRAA